MRVISLNINGIRSGATKGFFSWLEQQQADVICLQEIKALETQLTDAIFSPEGYYRYLFSAQKPGYSGVAIYSKREPDEVKCGLGWSLADNEGRYIQADFGNLSIASLYLPSGSSGEERQIEKFRFLDKFTHDLQLFQKQKRDFIICGDLNIVHKEIDIKNWAGNQKNSGCLPEERAWLDKLFGEMQWVDAFRVLNPEPHQYTWWSNRGNARANNVGWRIDYQVISPSLKDSLRNTSIYKDTWFSDHAPLTVDYYLS
jgi:exodeoxyribonuclease-3